VLKDGFEFADFKITFAISVAASLSKLRLTLMAEDHLAQKLKTNDDKR
jgi:hypothetical protein